MLQKLSIEISQNKGKISLDRMLTFCPIGTYMSILYDYTKREHLFDTKLSAI